MTDDLATKVARQDATDTLENLLVRINVDKPAKADIEAFKRALKADPNLLDPLADMASLAKNHFANSMYNSYVMREAVRAGMQRTAQALGYASATALERLLIDNIVLCWARLFSIENSHTNAFKGEISMPLGEYRERRLSVVQGRYLRACESLARVRRLLRPASASVQVNIGDKQINVA